MHKFIRRERQGIVRRLRPLSAVVLAVLLCGFGLERESIAQAPVGFSTSYASAAVNPGLITTLAVLNTVVPVAIGAKLLHDETAEVLGGILLGWGWIVGPSPFSLYFGNTTAGFVGLGVRGALVVAGAAATSGGTWDEDGSSGTEIALLGLMVVSALTAVLEIVGLPGAVARHNAAKELSIVPIWLGGESVGVRVTLAI